MSGETFQGIPWIPDENEDAPNTAFMINEHPTEEQRRLLDWLIYLGSIEPFKDMESTDE